MVNPPQVPEQFKWAKLPDSTKSGLEDTLVNLNAPIVQLQRIGELARRQDPEAQEILDQTRQKLKESIKWHYEAMGFRDQELQQQTDLTYGLFLNPESNKQAFNTLVGILQETGKKLYDCTPASIKQNFAEKAYKAQFETAFGMKLDAWKEGTLIDNLKFDELKDEYKPIFMEALKDGKSLMAFIGEHRQYMQRLQNEARNGNQEIMEKVKTKVEALEGQVKKYVEALIVGAYGFSKDLSNTVAEGIIENPQAMVYLQQVFSLATKKVALTLDKDKAKELQQSILNARANAMYGAPGQGG